MTRTLTIDPITRIEGHARIILQLDDRDEVADAVFQVTQFRGFEKLCEGRPFTEMPSLMARTCGICPVSHLIAAAKACDQILAVTIPDSAKRLRRLVNYGQLIQSHALSFFHLSSPDLLLGFDAPPARRNLVALAASHPELARDGIALRRIGQQVIEWTAGERIHPSAIVPGGFSRPMTADTRDRIAALIPGAIDITLRTIDRFREGLSAFATEIEAFGQFDSLFMGLEGPDGALEFYDGTLGVIDAQGRTLQTGYAPDRYADLIDEAVESFSYLKSPYYRPMGYPAGLYRVGPLARLNLARRIPTPRAADAWGRYRPAGHPPLTSCFHYHHARLIEVLHALECIGELMAHPDLLDPHVRAMAGVNRLRGIGVAEAPRGTLIHDYTVDAQGLVQRANLIIATGHNHLAMNRALLQTARTFVKGHTIPEGALNRVEAVIRCFDPCLSCSTHAVGTMPLEVELRSADGITRDRRTR